MNDQGATLVCAEMHGYVGNPHCGAKWRQGWEEERSHVRGLWLPTDPFPKGTPAPPSARVHPAIVPNWRRGPAGCNAALRACSLPPRCLGSWPLVPVYSGFSIWVCILLRPSAIPSPYLRIFVKMRSKGSPIKTQRWFPISQAPPPPANKHGPRTVFWADESGWETLFSVSGAGSAAEWGAGRKTAQASWCLRHCGPAKVF